MERQREYASQFFGFPPEEVSDDLNAETQEVLGMVLQAMEQKMREKMPQLGAEEVGEAFQGLEARYREKVEKIMERTGSFCSAHIFRVPPHVLLPEDEAWDGETEEEVVRRLDQVMAGMEQRRERIQNLIYRKSVLTNRLAGQNAACDRQERAQSEEEAMCRSSGVGDLIDGLTATQLARRSLQQRLAELGEVRREMGLGGRKRPAGCRLVSREKRQEVQEGVERLVAELEL